jgi:hypothetical protein
MELAMLRVDLTWQEVSGAQGQRALTVEHLASGRVAHYCVHPGFDAVVTRARQAFAAS